MKKIIIGNWKMNPGSPEEAKKLFRAVKNKASRLRKTKCVICPPSIYIEALGKISSPSCQIGGQDSFWEREGAYTGEISPGMLKRSGVKYVILGHSEKRELGDTDEIVNKKIKLALDYHMVVILCVGERVRDDEGKYLNFLKGQINESLKRISPQYYKNIIIAYEPIWAIGSRARGVSTPEDFLEKSIFIRKVISQITNKKLAMGIPIIYGGSASDINTEGFLKKGRADGLLVGRASIDAKKFNKILEISDLI